MPSGTTPAASHTFHSCMPASHAPVHLFIQLLSEECSFASFLILGCSKPFLNGGNLSVFSAALCKQATNIRMLGNVWLAGMGPPIQSSHFIQLFFEGQGSASPKPGKMNKGGRLSAGRKASGISRWGIIYELFFYPVTES